MGKRVRQLFKSGLAEIPRSSMGKCKVAEAVSLGLLFARWERQAARPLRGELSCQLMALVPNPHQGDGSLADFSSDLVRLTLVRVRAGDSQALTEYAKWVYPPKPGWLDVENTSLFEVLGKHMDHPAIATAAEGIFNDPKSPWNPLFQARPNTGSYGHSENCTEYRLQAR